MEKLAPVGWEEGDPLELSAILKGFGQRLRFAATDHETDMTLGSLRAVLMEAESSPEGVSLFQLLEGGREIEQINSTLSKIGEFASEKEFKVGFVVEENQLDDMINRYSGHVGDGKVHFFTKNQAQTLALLEENAADMISEGNEIHVMFPENADDDFIADFLDGTELSDRYRLFKFLTESLNPLVLEFSLPDLDNWDQLHRTILSQA